MKTMTMLHKGICEGAPVLLDEGVDFNTAIKVLETIDNFSYGLLIDEVGFSCDNYYYNKKGYVIRVEKYDNICNK